MPGEQTKLLKQKPDNPLLEIVLSALAATRRIPEEKPQTALPVQFDRDALRAFSIEQVSGGYVANVEFDVERGAANTIGTPDANPLPTHKAAFVAGAKIICEVVTGSCELPFLVSDTELLVATVSARGKPVVMRRPFPQQCA